MNQYDYLRDKLHDYSVKVDKEKIWKETAHAIPQRRKRRMLLLLFLGLLLGTAWLGYTLNSSSITSPLAANENHNTSEVSNDKVMENKSMSSTMLTTEAGLQLKRDKPQKTNPAIHSTQHEQLKTRNESTATRTVADLGNSASGDMEVFTVFPTAGNQMNTNATTSLQVENATEETEGVISSHILLGLNYARSTMAPTTPLVNPENSLPDELNSIDLNTAHIPIILVADSRKRISFSVIAALGFSTLDIKARNNASSEMADLQRHAVRSLEHLSMDFSGSMSLTNSLSAAASLGWNQWTTETRQHTTSYHPFTRDGVTSIIIDENGVQQPVQGKVDGVQVLHKNLVRYTQYQTITAALSLHQTLWRKHRMSADLFAEGNVVLSDQAKGSTFDTEGELQRFSKQESPFKLKTAVGFGGGIKMNYQLSSHLRMSASLGYQPVTYQWHQSDQHIEWTHSVVRGELGMRYLLHD